MAAGRRGSAAGAVTMDVIHDVIGVGFGPSNLALAIALDEALRRGGMALSHHFIEKQPGFTWHGGMLLPDSDMQVSFLKDLVTLRDPTSRFSFVNYLHQKGRLEAFINQSCFFPSRIEFNDYLGWAAAQFAGCCSYGEEVVALEPEAAQGIVTGLRVISSSASGGEVIRRARNLVVAIGGRPHVPDLFARLPGDPGDAPVFHSAHYLNRVGGLGLERPGRRVAVIGGGQSAAEVVLDLYNRFPGLAIDMIFRGHALKPSDNTPFVNEIFDPDFTDFIYGQSADDRDRLVRTFRNTNYAVVDADLILRIYKILYQQKVQGEARLALLAHSKVTWAAFSQQDVELLVSDSLADTAAPRQYSAVVLATGYDRDIRQGLLSGLHPYVEDFSIGRDYLLRMRPTFRPHIHLQGYSESSHGLSDTLLSVLAIRAREIADSLLRNNGGHANAPRPRAIAHS
jgi:L-ornithine N5-oxygenase